MSENSLQYLDLIFFGAIAVFLLLRLRSILGKRTGIDQISTKSKSDFYAVSEREEDQDSHTMQPYINLNYDISNNNDGINNIALIQQGIEHIRTINKDFNPIEFLDGARNAFKMIIQAYANGDIESVKFLLSPEVLNEFIQAISTRESKKEYLHNTLVRFKNVSITDIMVSEYDIVIIVTFISEQINIIKDSYDVIIEGEDNTIIEIIDIWSFSRNAKSMDPNWILIKTTSP